MQAQQERPPAYVADHDHRSLVLPSVPTHDLPTHQTQNGPIVLPDFKSLGLPSGRPSALQLNQPYQTNSQWGTVQPHTFPHSAAVSPRSYGSAMLPPPSPMETDIIMSDSRKYRSLSIMSLDDPETREAAETLSGLRNMDYKRSSSAHSNATTLHSLTRDEGSVGSMEITLDDDEEPLLSLITESHPWIGGTINTSLYAYNSTMHYTPAFIQSLIEKNVSSVANGLGTVGRKTGVQNRVRQYFGDTPERRSARENARASNKRPRQPSIEYDDLEKGFLPSPQSRQRSRTGSQTSYTETLPAYDDKSAPAYDTKSRHAVQSHQTWKAKWMITTSGLGVALSDASLRSLKFCLSLLQQASSHLTEIMMALRSLLEQYNQAISGAQTSGQSRCNLTPDQEAASQAIAERIKSLGADIINTLQSVTTNVSRYTGGALPENAGALVRRQLLSIPQRWQVAQQQTESTESSEDTGASEATRTGQRWIVFAEQGLDMITQVNIVLTGTVESAEKWLDSMGRKRRASASSSASMIDHKHRSGLMSPPVTLHETHEQPHGDYDMHIGTKL